MTYKVKIKIIRLEIAKGSIHCSFDVFRVVMGIP
jgi:hypothetical protein